MAFSSKAVKDKIIEKFGENTGENIVEKIKECIEEKKDGLGLIDCVLKKLDYSAQVEKEIYDFLYHFVIVG